MIPGGNILNMALSVIARQSFQYYKFAARVTNEAGFDVPTYSAPLSITGSVQPIPRTMYSNLGLDFQKNYYNFYLAKNIIDINRDVSGDQMVFNCKQYQCISKTDWFALDGWDAVLCVEVPSSV